MIYFTSRLSFSSHTEVSWIQTAAHYQAAVWGWHWITVRRL